MDLCRRTIWRLQRLISAINPDTEEVCDDFDVDETVLEWPTTPVPSMQLGYADVDGDGCGEIPKCWHDARDTSIKAETVRMDWWVTSTKRPVSSIRRRLLRRYNDDGAIGCTDYFGDVDGDGYGDAGDGQCLCITEGSTPQWWTPIDDSDLNVNPANSNTVAHQASTTTVMGASTRTVPPTRCSCGQRWRQLRCRN